MQSFISSAECGTAAKPSLCSQKALPLCWPDRHGLVWDMPNLSAAFGVTHSGRCTQVTEEWVGFRSMHHLLLTVLPPTQGNIPFKFLSLFKYLSCCLLVCGLQLSTVVKNLIPRWEWLWGMRQPRAPSGCQSRSLLPWWSASAELPGHERNWIRFSFSQERWKQISQQTYIFGDHILVVKCSGLNLPLWRQEDSLGLL